MKKKVVVLGGGFGGLACVKALAKSDVEIFLIDKNTHHVFSPLLYQVATSGLTAADISAPLRNILKRQKNVTVLLDEVLSLDHVNNSVDLLNYGSLSFDYLVIATGLQSSYFGNDDWSKVAPGLKTIKDAMSIRRKMLLSFERAEITSSMTERKKNLTFVVVGGGPTGVELAGAIKEIAHYTLSKDFNNFNPKEARVILVEGSSKILGAYPNNLSISAEKQLDKLGVEVLKNSMVKNIEDGKVTLKGRDLVSGKEFDEEISAGCIFWTAGLGCNNFAKDLPFDKDPVGRIKVNSTLDVPHSNNIFVVGDLAHIKHKGRQVPGLAPAAIQMGKLAAKNISADLKGKERKSFSYINKGTMATIGKHSAVANIKGLKFSGIFAWVLWLFVHLMTLVDFRNRISVFMKWLWNYLSWKSSARVLVDAEARDLQQKKSVMLNSKAP